MLIVDINQEKKCLDLAEGAARCFALNPGHYICVEGDTLAPEAGGLLAIRWDNCTVMVVELSDSIPLLYSTHDLGVGELEDAQAPDGKNRLEAELARVTKSRKRITELLCGKIQRQRADLKRLHEAHSQDREIWREKHVLMEELSLARERALEVEKVKGQLDMTQTLLRIEEKCNRDLCLQLQKTRDELAKLKASLT